MPAARFGDQFRPAVASAARSAVAIVVAFAAVWARPATEPAAVGVGPLHDGDRVVFLGDAFFEREGQRGFIETALTAVHPSASITFRNLGWSGDTVWADSRGVFDPPRKGYERMLALVAEQKPTVVFIAYGRNESEKGSAGVGPFHDQLAALCDDLVGAAAGKAGGSAAVRLVLVTPSRFETADADRRNAALAEYCEAIRGVAAAKQAAVVDLFARLPQAPDPPLTENGVHLSDAGYAVAARVFAEACGRQLPVDFAAASARLRSLVAAKNTLFFHRWRPANETYIFLFRKHEQGNNAVEMPQFDPLVARAEQEIRAGVASLATARPSGAGDQRR